MLVTDDKPFDGRGVRNEEGKGPPDIADMVSRSKIPFACLSFLMSYSSTMVDFLLLVDQFEDRQPHLQHHTRRPHGKGRQLYIRTMRIITALVLNPEAPMIMNHPDPEPMICTQCGKYGKIGDCYIPRDYYTQRYECKNMSHMYKSHLL